MARILNDLSTKAKTMQKNAEPKERQRGVSPVDVTFRNLKGEDGPRPNHPGQIEFYDKKSQTGHTVDLTNVDDGTIYTLAALMFERIVLTYVRNHFDPNGSATAMEFAKARAVELAEGKVHVRLGGAGVPRQADVSLWVDAMELASKKNKRPATEAQVEGFRNKLLSMTGVDRNKEIARLRKVAPNYDASVLEIMSKRASARSKEIAKEVDFDALFA